MKYEITWASNRQRKQKQIAIIFYSSAALIVAFLLGYFAGMYR